MPDFSMIRSQVPGYETNRQRTATILHHSFNAFDTYAVARPALFWAGLFGMALSGMGLMKRARKGREEAGVLYTATFIASGATAWTARPTEPGPVAKQAAPEDQATAAYIDWLDAEAARLERLDPQFASKAFLRLAHSPTVKPTWDHLPPFLQALFV